MESRRNQQESDIYTNNHQPYSSNSSHTEINEEVFERSGYEFIDEQIGEDYPEPLTVVDDSINGKIKKIEKFILKKFFQLLRFIQRVAPGNIDGKLSDELKFVYILFSLIIGVGITIIPRALNLVDEDEEGFCVLLSMLSFIPVMAFLGAPSYAPNEDDSEEEPEDPESVFADEELEPLVIRYSRSQPQYIVYTLISASLTFVAYLVMVGIYACAEKYYFNKFSGVSIEIHILVIVSSILLSFLALGSRYKETAVINFTNEGIYGRIKGLFTLQCIEDRWNYLSGRFDTPTEEFDQLPPGFAHYDRQFLNQNVVTWDSFRAFSVHNECIVLWGNIPEERFMSWLYITMGMSLDSGSSLVHSSLRLTIPQDYISEVEKFLSHKLRQVKLYPNARLIYGT
ncbi:MAG: hypothetical protein ACI38Q_06460 [Candidatus Bruticola sp.]